MGKQDYAEDYEEMKRDKGYYLELDELPVPKAFTNQQMMQNILDFSYETYQKKRAPFMEMMQYYDDGHASEAVVQYIVSKSKEAR